MPVSMTHWVRRALVAVSMSAGLLSGAAFAQDNLQVEITGLAEVSGNLYISVYDSKDTWLGEEVVVTHKVVIDESRDGELVKSSMSLPPGAYALSIYYDENNNDKLDTNFIGIPKEPVALSNNARPKFGPPKYKDAVFDLGDGPVLQQINMADM